jgi:type II secretory pathway component PulK
MGSSRTVPSLTDQSESEPRSQLIALLQQHLAPGYAVGGRSYDLKDVALQEREAAAEAKGAARSILGILETRCIPLNEIQRQRPLGPDARIEDPCLVTPFKVAALLDAAKADHAVVEALAAKGSPAIRERDAVVKAEGRAEGRIAGIAESVLEILEARGIPVSEAQRQEILSCQDSDRLSRWLRRAVLVSSAGEVTSEP